MSEFEKKIFEFKEKIKVAKNLPELTKISSEISNFPLSFARNSSFIFLRSDIFTDYFFREIKQ